MSAQGLHRVATDISLLAAGLALWLGFFPVVTFHLMFVLMTIAAFLLELRPFVVRLILGSLGGTVGIARAVSVGDMAPEEMLEVPLLALIATVVFLIAERRTRTESTLRSVNLKLTDISTRYELLVGSMPAVVYTAGVGVDGRWTSVAPQCRELLGIDADELISGDRTWFDVIHPEDRDRVLADEGHAADTNTRLDSSYRIVLPDGSIRWLRDQAVLVSQASGLPHFHGVITDITGARKIQRDLERAIRQEGAIAELGRLALEARDVDRVLDRAVVLIAETLEAAYCKVLELLPDDSALLLRAGVGWNPGVVGSTLVETGTMSQAGYTLLRDDVVLVDDLAGETRFTGPELLVEHGVRSGVSTVIRDDGRHYGVLGVHTRTVRRFSPSDGQFLDAMANVLAAALRLERAEAEIAFQQRRFEAAFDAAVSAIALVRPTGEFISVNPTMARMLGYSEAELVSSQDFRSITHPDDVADCIKATREILAGDRAEAQLLKRYVTKDGQTLWTELSLAAVRDEEERVLYLVAQSFDVTAKLAAEAARDRFFETSIDLLCISGFDGYFKELNPAWEETLGFTREELMAAPYLEFVHPDDRIETLAEAGSLAQGSITLQFSNRYVHKDGSVRWLEWRALPFPEEQTIFAIARDVTAHRELEQQLRQSQKMEAVGRLAGGVAHDFNNLLAVIMNYCDFARSACSEDQAITADLDEIRAAAERGANLVAQLLAFSRKDISQARPVQLNDVVSGFERLLVRTLGEDLLLSIRLADDLPLIESDPAHLDQVVMNLVTNARDAMPNGGELVLETAKVVLTEPRETFGGIVPPGTYVSLTVSDTGSGIAPADIEHVFEPFFTTKDVGEGTGLGLATTYANVAEAGGYISVESELGQGTRFCLYWPAADRRAAVPATAAEALHRSHRPARVLVIEDDPGIRKILQRVLTSAGHEVVATANESEAIRAAGEWRFDLVISDVIMPGRSGPEVVGGFQDLGYSFEVIYMSGYTNNVISRHAGMDDANFIQKPFQASDVLNKIDEVLGAAPQRSAKAIRDERTSQKDGSR